MMAEARRMDAKMQAKVDRVEASMIDKIDSLHGKIEGLEALLSTLVEQGRRSEPEV